jgi:hypothetical protein
VPEIRTVATLKRKQDEIATSIGMYDRASRRTLPLPFAYSRHRTGQGLGPLRRPINIVSWMAKLPRRDPRKASIDLQKPKEL